MNQMDFWKAGRGARSGMNVQATEVSDKLDSFADRQIREVWDNRVTAHSAILDGEDKARRHIARITPQAERPVE